MTKPEISILLYRTWDPLGVNGCAPTDEYDDYANELEALLGQDASVEAIRAYLSEVRATILLTAPDATADRRVAQLIKASS